MPNGRAGTRQPGRTALRLALAALTLFVVTCREEDSSPEAAVRRTLAAIEAAARAKDLSEIVEHVSEAYADDRGNDRQAVRQIAAFHLLRNQSVHTLTRIRSVSFPDPGLADAEALVAMAGTAIPVADVLATVRADFYRFDVSLREEEPGTWRVTSARWQPAVLDDFR
jgi:hypothetical protein